MNLLKLFSNKLEYTADELAMKEVVEKFVSDPNSKFRIAPLTQEILIKQPAKGYYLLVNSREIKIVNHKFSICKQYRVSFIDDIKEMVYNKIQEDRDKAFAEIFENELNLLLEIKQNLE